MYSWVNKGGQEDETVSYPFSGRLKNTVGSVYGVGGVEAGSTIEHIN